MSIGKASDFRVHDQAAADNIAKRPADSSYITLSDDTIADDASIGDVLGTLSITAAYVGTPRWEIIGQSNFAVNATTGVVTVARALTAGSDRFKVKLRGTTPQINSPTFAITVVTGGGGGGVPEWVPADAKIYIDLVNVRAWTEADGEVAIDTLLGTDANTDAWGPTEYVPADLEASGLLRQDAGKPVALIGNARTMLLVSGATMVSKTLGQYALPQTVFLSSDGLALVFLSTADNVAITASDSNGALLTTVPCLNSMANVEDTTTNVIALTLVSNRIDLVANGTTASTAVLNETSRPSANPLVAVLFDWVGHLQSITIYDALPSTAGLSTLSETGVTNTAPTITNNPADFTPTFAEAAAVTGSTVATVTTADPEGNPLTFTLPVNVGSKFSVDATGIITTTEDLLAGGSPYTFTLRATDPGGLYVEQEFTITVTA